MKENKIMSLIEFEDKCEEVGYTEYIFTDDNQVKDDYNIRFFLTFDTMRMYYNKAYNKILLGCKNNCIEFKRVIKVEECEKFDNCTMYKIYCKNKPFKKARVFTITAVESK